MNTNADTVSGLRVLTDEEIDSVNGGVQNSVLYFQGAVFGFMLSVTAGLVGCLIDWLFNGR